MLITNDFLKEWSYREEHMIQLLSAYPKLSQIYLYTILLSEEDLTESSELHNFANFTKSKYKIGCIIEFSYIYNM